MQKYLLIRNSVVFSGSGIARVPVGKESVSLQCTGFWKQNALRVALFSEPVANIR